MAQTVLRLKISRCMNNPSVMGGEFIRDVSRMKSRICVFSIRTVEIAVIIRRLIGKWHHGKTRFQKGL